MNTFKGSMVALVTPLRADFSIDWDSFESLINWHINSGTKAIAVAGTTGESATFSFDEKKAIARFAQEIANNRIPIIAGAGANSTAEALDLTLFAYKIGCAATLQVTPYYNTPPQKGLFKHYQTIALSAPLPLILYNVPNRTGVDLLPETTIALSKIPNIIGIKEATNLDRIKLIKNQIKNPNFLLLSGTDSDIAQGYQDNLIDGAISVTANLIPKIMTDIHQNPNRLTINEPFKPLHKALFIEPNPIPVKWALAKMGKIKTPTLRLPLIELSNDKQTQLEKLLQTLQLI